MYVLTALRNAFSFPIGDEQLEMIAIERGLSIYDEFTADVAQTKEFRLAKADMIRNFLTTPNISEGGVSISITDRGTLLGLANSIYSKYGESLIMDEYPTVTPIAD